MAMINATDVMFPRSLLTSRGGSVKPSWPENGMAIQHENNYPDSIEMVIDVATHPEHLLLTNSLDRSSYSTPCTFKFPFRLSVVIGPF